MRKLAALVGFSAVGQRLPYGFRLTPDGKNLKVSGRLSYHGRHVPVSATVALAVSGAGISMRAVNLSMARGITLPLAAFAHRLRVVVPLGTLPLHLHLTSVHVTAGGLRIGAAARDVRFARA